MNRAIVAVFPRFLLMIPVCWFAYWVLIMGVHCVSPPPLVSVTGCLGTIPIVLIMVLVDPISENPLLKVYLPVILGALLSAVFWAWVAGEFRRRPPR